MAAEDYSIRINVDSSSATQAQANLNRLNSTVTQTERELNNTSSAARSAAASLSGLGSSSAGIHSMTAAMSSYAQSATQAANNTQSATREISQMGTTATRTSESMRAISNAIGLIGLGAFAKDVLNTNIEMENLRARLDATFGSMAKGQQAFNDILQIAKETPQSVNEISKSFVMLKNFGIEPTMKVMQDLTNMTSKVGGNADTLSGIVRGLGQAYAKGKLQAEEANQMIERGVPVYSLLSKELHKTTAEIMDMMSAGELTRPVIEKLIASMGSSSVGASTKMMETLGGKISMLGDSWAQFESALLNDKSEGLIKNIVTGWMAILDGFTAKMNQSISAQIVDLNEKLKTAENRKSFISKGMESLGIIDSPNQIRSQIESLKQKRLSDFQANRQYEQSQKQEKATQAEADAIAKKTKANDEFTKKFGTALEKENLAIKDAEEKYGELTASMKEQIHQKYFHKEMTHASASAHKAENAAMREAKQQQDEYNRLIESTPYGEYNAQVDKLTNALKNGGINQQTYSTLLSEANDKLLTSTDYVKEHTKALDEQARATERAFQATARGKFEKGYSELMTQKPFMSETEYATGQDKLTTDYLKQTQGADFKTPAEQGKEALKAFNAEMDKSAKAFENLGNSGSMAFDGILGGISAVAGAIGSFSGEMTKLNDGFESASKGYQDLMLQQGVSIEEKEKATADYYKLKDKYESASFKAEISGARQIAGATKNLFGEKSAARKAFHAVEMGMSVIEMAMAAKKMIVDVAAGAANMFAQGGFAGFAGVAAMGAVMAGLGFAISGSSSEPQDMRGMKNDSGTTGTVKGDYEKSSNSIENSMKLLNQTNFDQLTELKDLNSNFTALVNSVDKTISQAISLKGSFVASTKSMSGVTGGVADKNPLGSTGSIAGSLGASIALGATGAISTAGLYAGAALINAGATSLGIGISTAAAGAATAASSTGAAMGLSGATGQMVGGAVLGLAGGLVLAGLQYGLGKLLGIGKTKYEAIGNGIVTGIGQMTLDGMKEGITAFDYSTVKATTKGWFSDTKKIYDVINGIDAQMSVAFNSIFDNLGKSLGASIKYLNIGDLVQNAVTVPQMKFDLSKAKTSDEINKVITDAINTMSDKLATEMAGGLFEPMQKAGEGMLETMMRVTKEVANVSAAFSKLGMNIKMSSMGAITLSNALVSMYESAPNANDALKNFISTMEAFTNVVLTPLQQFQYAAKNWVDFASKFNEKNNTKLSTSFSGLTRENIMSAYDETNQKLVKAAEAEAVLTKNSQAVTNATAPYTAFDPSQLDQKAWAGLVSGGYEKMSSTSLSANVLSLIKNGAASANQYQSIWKDMLRVVESNDAKMASGQSALTSDPTMAKYFAAGGGGIEQWKKDVEAAKVVTATAAESVASLTMKTKDFDLALKFIEKSESLSEGVLKNITSATETKTRAQQKELSTLDDTTDITKDLHEKTIAAFNKWNATLPETERYTVITQKAVQKFTYTLDDAAKAFDKLNDAGKYIKDFGKSIKDWVENLRATQLGTPQSQLQAAQKSFESRAQMIKNPFASIEEKRTALSGITGYADTYINAIKNFYASSEEGQKLIADVVKSVSDMPEQLDVAQMQLNVLEQIKGNTDNFKDFPPLVAAELSKVKLQYEFVDVQKALPTDATGRLSDSTLVALNETLDKIGTGLLNTKFQTPEVSGVTLQTASSSLAFIEKLATTSMPDVNKILSLESLSNGLTAAGTAIANYDYAPTETKLATLKTISTDFSKIITDSSAQMSDANFTAVFSSAMSSVSNAVTALPTNLTAMASAIDIAKNSVGIWVTALTNGLSSDGAAFAVVTSLNTSGITLDASLDDTTKAQILEDIAFSVQQTSSKLAGFIDGSSYTAGDVSSSTAEILDSTTWAVSRVLTPIDEKQFGSKDVSDTISSILTTGLAQQTKITEQIDKWEVVDADVKSSVDELIKTGALGLFTTASGILSKSDIINAETLVDSISQLVDGSKGFYTTAKGIVSSQDLSTKTKELGVDLLTESTSGFFGRTKLLVDDTALTTDKLKSGIGSLVGSIDGLIGSVNNEVLKIQAKIDAEAAAEKARIDANTSAKSNDSSGISDSPATQPAIPNSLTGLGASNDKLYGKSDLETIFTTGVSATQKKTFVEKYGKYGNQPLFSSYFTDKSALSSETEKVLKSYDRYGGTLRYAKLIDGKIHVEFINPTNSALKQKSSYSVDIKDMPAFAKGGIANQPSIFGEAGAEAAVPLPDGRSIPVTLSRDSANDNGETVAELKEISRKQEVMINTLIAAAQESRKQNQTLVTEIEGLRTDTRLRRAA